MKEFEEENLAMGPLFMVLGVSTFFVVAVIFALTGLYNAERQSLEDTWAGAKVADTQANEAEQAERLGTYAVLDEASGKLRIPIERAMELTVKERSEG